MHLRLPPWFTSHSNRAVVYGPNGDSHDLRQIGHPLREHTQLDAVTGDQWLYGEDGQLSADGAAKPVHSRLIVSSQRRMPGACDHHRSHHRGDRGQCRKQPRQRYPVEITGEPSPGRMGKSFDVHQVRG